MRALLHDILLPRTDAGVAFQVGFVLVVLALALRGHGPTATCTFAVVGASPSQGLASHGVMGVLQRHGYTVIPVNPHAAEVRGLSCYPDLASIPGPVDVVDIFRRPGAAGAHVDEAIAIGAKAVWMQLGVVDEVAAQRARNAGLQVVMDRCPAIELGRRTDERASA